MPGSKIQFQYGEVINAVVDPRELTCDLIVGTIKQTEGSVSFEEAARIACNQNQVVRDYIGPKLKLRENNRLHEISERVRLDSNIKTIGLRPLVLKWLKTKEENEAINKQTDQDGVEKNNTNRNNEGNGEEEGNAV